MLAHAISFGGVPVGSFNSAGMVVVASDPTAGVDLVPAQWAVLTETREPNKLDVACVATTKKGERCAQPFVADTELCIGHWNQVVAMVAQAERDAAKQAVAPATSKE